MSLIGIDKPNNSIFCLNRISKLNFLGLGKFHERVVKFYYIKCFKITE